MEEKLLKIINHYGILKQLKYFQSEVFELNEAIFEKEYHSFHFDVDNENITIAERDKLTKHIAEELADVMVMLEQFKLYYGISSEEITEIFWSKVDRQLGRIENENNK